MAKSKSIPKEVKEKVLEIVKGFNKEQDTAFSMTFRGQFAYLAKTQQQPMANIFKKMLAQKMGIPLNRMPKEKAPKVETKLCRRIRWYN